jgi:hypothetical protein
MESVSKEQLKEKALIRLIEWMLKGSGANFKGHTEFEDVFVGLADYAEAIECGFESGEMREAVYAILDDLKVSPELEVMLGTLGELLWPKN